jgi:hypothetical protein
MVLSWDILGDSMVRVGLVGVCFGTHCDGCGSFLEKKVVGVVKARLQLMSQ